jgi:ABC-2 type transport system permease protein
VLWRVNLQSAAEYRAAFLTQVLGMMLNNAAYFAFWVLFFQRFGAVRGWDLQDMMRLFGVVACGFGAGVFLFGNAVQLAEIVADGRLDYYLSLPRPVLTHVLASFALAGGFGALTLARFAVAAVAAMTTFVSFLVLVQSLVFWLGSASMLGRQMTDAMLTFAMYPITLFDGSARLMLYTLVPAALRGALPAQLVGNFRWVELARLAAAVALLAVLATVAFYRGLRRYESGSALQVQV